MSLYSQSQDGISTALSLHFRRKRWPYNVMTGMICHINFQASSMDEEDLKPELMARVDLQLAFFGECNVQSTRECFMVCTEDQLLKITQGASQAQYILHIA